MRVRGFRPSIPASKMRLNAIAAERAPTIASTIQASFSPKIPKGKRLSRKASNAPVKANGSANTECSNLIISSVSRSRFQNAIFATILIHALAYTVLSGNLFGGLLERLTDGRPFDATGNTSGRADHQSGERRGHARRHARSDVPCVHA